MLVIHGRNRDDRSHAKEGARPRHGPKRTEGGAPNTGLHRPEFSDQKSVWEDG